MASIPSFRAQMQAYLQAFLQQILVSVACNGAHSLKQRLARWLLMMRDRGDDDTLPITQTLLAEMLGVHRPTVTRAAQELERAGLIARGDGKSLYSIAGASRRRLANAISWFGRISRPTFRQLTSDDEVRRIGNIHYRHTASTSPQSKTTPPKRMISGTRKLRRALA
jgi:DNA-binding MarR family transcriptional regulator